MSELTVQPMPASSPSPPVIERRAWVRYTTSLDGSCQPIPLHHGPAQEGWWQGKVVNLSATGLCLNLVRRFEPGTPLIFDLPQSIKGSTWTLTGKVVRVAGPAGGGWLLGCQFDIPLTEVQLSDLIQTTGDGHPSSQTAVEGEDS